MKLICSVLGTRLLLLGGRALLPLLVLLVAIGGISCTSSSNSGSNGAGGGGNVSITPANTSVAPNGTLIFSATINGVATQAVTWSASAGKITSAGVYSAPAQSGTYTITATSTANPGSTNSTQVTVVAASNVTVSVTPTTSTVGLSSTTQFTATVNGAVDKTVTWDTSLGSSAITSQGLFTAPGSAGIVTILARSNANPSATGTATVTVSNNAPSIIVTPSNQSVNVGAQVQFQAAVQNLASQSVTWSATGGTINATGLFTAGNAAGTFTVTATSTAQPAVSGSTSVTINPITVNVKPQAVDVFTGQNQTFTSTVQGTGNKSVTWSTNVGSITQAGVFTAPWSTAQPATITATSAAFPAFSGTATATIVNTFSFTDGLTTGWSSSTITTSPNGNVMFLGPFGSGAQSVVLTLNNLPNHSTVNIALDLEIIGGWTGNAGNPFAITYNTNNSGGVATLLSQTFSNTSGDNQSYPDSGNHPPGNGATATNSLGYSFAGLLYNDSTYHYTASFSHNVGTLTLTFTGNLSGSIPNPSWGLTNVQVIPQ